MARRKNRFLCSAEFNVYSIQLKHLNLICDKRKCNRNELIREVIDNFLLSQGIDTKKEMAELS